MPDELAAVTKLINQDLYALQWACVFKDEDEGVYYVEINGPKTSGLKSCFSKDADPLEAAKKALTLWNADNFSSSEDIKEIEQKKINPRIIEIAGKK